MDNEIVYKGTLNCNVTENILTLIQLDLLDVLEHCISQQSDLVKWRVSYCVLWIISETVAQSLLS